MKAAISDYLSGDTLKAFALVAERTKSEFPPCSGFFLMKRFDQVGLPSLGGISRK